MKILYQGAESKIYLDVFDGQEVIVKERIAKNYRIKQLDEKLRKTRTRKEVKLLTEVRKLNIPTPKILSVDEKDHRIIMEYINGHRLKEYLNSISINDVKSICFKLGKQIGKLHSNNIVHGDLTTSNMILKDDKIYFIDFSLGEFTERVENKAVDMKLLKEALESTHFKIFDDAWNSLVLGYKEEYKNADVVFNQLKEIEKRGRYVNREDSL
ncbi:MAG: KEOPS complex kinase/ATPase Bud32 [Candidatus Aenigmatarchaeota archaeon]